MIKLVSPNLEYEDDVKVFLDEISKSDADLPWAYAGMACLEEATSYSKWVQEVEDIKNGINMPDGYVKAAVYYAVDEENKIVGMINLRYELNDYLFNFGGHIGYSIRPGYRKKGYGTQMLNLALEECKKLNIERVLITCHEENEGSRKLIVKCGGIYENTVKNKEEIIERYWIDIKEN